MRITKKITSIVLAVLMVVSMMSVMAVSASAAEYNANDGVKLSASQLAVGDVILTDSTWGTSIKHEDYKFIMKGGTYSVGSVDNLQEDDVVAPELDSYNPIAFSYVETDVAMVFQDKNFNNTYYLPLDAEGNLSKKWYVLAADHENKTITFGGHVPVTYVAKIGDTGYATLADAFAAAQDGDTITVLADCAGNGIKVTPAGKFNDKGLTVDFNGHTYTVDGETVGSTGTETNGFQLLKNNNITFKNGTITSAKAKILVQNYSNLELRNMTLTLNNPDYTQGYTLSDNNGIVTINDTTITANPAGGYAFDVCRFSSYPSVTVIVTGGSVINGDVEISASKSDPKEGFTLSLQSGTLNGNIVIDPTAQTAMAADTENSGIAKTSTFSQDAPEGYRWTDAGEGMQVLTAIPYVAQIGSTKYETLEEAFAAAVDGDTIKVLADCSGNGIKVLKNRFKTNGLTVDFDGHTYTMDGATVGSTGTETQAFQLQYGNKITFKNGTLYSEKALFLVQNYSNLTLDGMTLTLDNPNYAYGYTLSNNNGNTVIKDTTINANPAGKFAFDVCRGGGSNLYPSVNVTVTGTSVINGNVEVDARNGDAKNGFSLTLESGTMNGDIKLTDNAKTAIDATPEKAKVTKENTFTQEAPADYKWVDNGNGTSSLVAKEYVAQIGETKYETLEEAFAAAVDGDKITVLADSTGNGIKVPQGKFSTNGLTVDFNGFEYVVDANTVGSTGTETNGFQLLKNNKITFKNGSINSGEAKILVQNYSDLTLEKMELSMYNDDYSSAYTLSNNNGNVVIDSSAISANTAGGFAFDVCRYASYPSVNVTVKGNSVIDGNVEIFASKSNPMNGFSLTLESGTLNGDIVVDKTAQNVINATPEKAVVTKAAAFNQEAPLGYEWVDNGDGTSTLAPATYPLDELITKAADGNNFGINSQYLAGTILGVQKKAKASVDAASTSDKGAQEAATGSDMRFVAVLDTETLQGADDYGFVLAKVGSDKNTTNTNFDNLKAHWGNGEKTVSAMNTYNNICGDEKYGDPTDGSTSYKYVTCAVNGVDDSSKIVARFYVVKGGKTYYAKYAGYNYQYRGVTAGLADLED